MATEHPYENDRAAAKARGHWFTVATKEKRGARWVDVHSEIADLHEAMIRARSLHAYEVSVFVRGGYIYWTTAHPEVFNSTVITMRGC
jgi:hypothetical protein